MVTVIEFESGYVGALCMACCHCILLGWVVGLRIPRAITGLLHLQRETSLGVAGSRVRGEERQGKAENTAFNSSKEYCYEAGRAGNGWMDGRICKYGLR